MLIQDSQITVARLYNFLHERMGGWGAALSLHIILGKAKEKLQSRGGVMGERGVMMVDWGGGHGSLL